MRRKVSGGAAHGARSQTVAIVQHCNTSPIYYIVKRGNNLEKKQGPKQLTWKGFPISPLLSCFLLSFWLTIVPGLFVFFIPKKSHLILPFGKGKNMSQRGLVLHVHDTYIPFSIHNQRIIFSAIIINLFQTLPILGNGTRKRVFLIQWKNFGFLGAGVNLHNQSLIWHTQA